MHPVVPLVQTRPCWVEQQHVALVIALLIGEGSVQLIYYLIDVEVDVLVRFDTLRVFVRLYVHLVLTFFKCNVANVTRSVLRHWRFDLHSLQFLPLHAQLPLVEVPLRVVLKVLFVVIENRLVRKNLCAGRHELHSTEKGQNFFVGLGRVFLFKNVSALVRLMPTRVACTAYRMAFESKSTWTTATDSIVATWSALGVLTKREDDGCFRPSVLLGLEQVAVKFRREKVKLVDDGDHEVTFHDEHILVREQVDQKRQPVAFELAAAIVEEQVCY